MFRIAAATIAVPESRNYSYAREINFSQPEEFVTRVARVFIGGEMNFPAPPRTVGPTKGRIFLQDQAAKINDTNVSKERKKEILKLV